MFQKERFLDEDSSQRAWHIEVPLRALQAFKGFYFKCNRRPLKDFLGESKMLWFTFFKILSDTLQRRGWMGVKEVITTSRNMTQSLPFSSKPCSRCPTPQNSQPRQHQPTFRTLVGLFLCPTPKNRLHTLRAMGCPGRGCLQAWKWSVHRHVCEASFGAGWSQDWETRRVSWEAGAGVGISPHPPKDSKNSKFKVWSKSRSLKSCICQDRRIEHILFNDLPCNL